MLFGAPILKMLCNCIPRTKYVRGILWFSRRYAAASAASAVFFILTQKVLIRLLLYLTCKLLLNGGYM